MTARATAAVLAAVLAFLPAAPKRAAAALGDCGQPISGGNSPTASDALFILQAAVGSQTCALCVCDVDGGASATVSASDALRVLRRAVGQSIELVCPDCSVRCEDSSAPECGGTCGSARTCAPNPLDPDSCACQNECELSAQPACGGSCDLGLPIELACTPVRVTVHDAPTDVCFCLPPDFVVCADAGAPACNGACKPGARCTSDGDAGCACEAQPPQGACAQATAPACGGTCGEGLLCVAGGDGCECVDAGGREDTCFDAQGPVCDGACSSGRSCDVNSLGSCECFEPCAVAQPPACGGSCSGGNVCTARTINLGDSDLALCECLPP